MSNLNSVRLITCFEYQRLVSEDFEFQKDFDYLVNQELACFEVGIKQGHVYLQVRHYLAKVILPSGTTLEILPKTNADAREKNEVELTRKWVRQMLVDIAQFDLQKIIPALDLSGSMTVSTDLKGLSDSLDYQLQSENYAKKTSSNASAQNVANAPWYEWLLNIAEDKIDSAGNILPNTYHKSAHNSPKAKGKLNLSEQFKTNWHRPHYLYSEQSLFKEDDLLKAFLATGWQHLQRLKNSHKPIHSVNEFSKVNVLPISEWDKTYRTLSISQSSWRIQLSPMQFRVLNEAFSWCWWVLNHLRESSSELKTKPIANSFSNTLPYPAFVINMNHAFEAWVLSRLKGWVAENLPNSELIMQPSFNWLQMSVPQLSTKSSNKSFESQNSKRLSEKASIRVIQKLQPDVCIKSENGLITHVIDIKYKNISKVQEISASDWQQLCVYKHHLQAEKGWLIFPMSVGFQDKIEVSSVVTSDKMCAIPFDVLSRTFKSI